MKQVIENAFSILVSKWRVLLPIIMRENCLNTRTYKPEKASYLDTFYAVLFKQILMLKQLKLLLQQLCFKISFVK